MPIPFNIRMGPSSPSGSIRDAVHFDSIRIEETGTFESVTASLAIRDAALAYTAMRGEWHLSIEWRQTGEQMFRGLVRLPTRELVTTEHGLQIEADDMAVMLDRCINTRKGVERPAGETFRSRVSWLFGELTHRTGSVFGGTVVAQPLLAAGFDYTTHVPQLTTNMPKQRFGTNLTLRQALERILGAASDSANYYVDWPYLHVFDDDNRETSRTAPYDINTAHNPGSGKVAPEEMLVDWDTSRLINGYMIRGKNAAGTGFYTDQDLLPGPWSVNLFGPRFAYLDGPDADTSAKAERLARAALRDTRNPVPRIAFSLTGEDKTVNGSNRWKGGQLVHVTSAAHGLNGAGADAGPWAGSVAMQPFRVVRVTTELLSGDGQRRVTVEAGGRRRNVWQGVPT